MKNEESGGVRAAIKVGGGVRGQIAVGNDIVQEMRHDSAPITDAEWAELRALLDGLRNRVAAEAPPTSATVPSNGSASSPRPSTPPSRKLARSATCSAGSPARSPRSRAPSGTSCSTRSCPGSSEPRATSPQRTSSSSSRTSRRNRWCGSDPAGDGERTEPDERDEHRRRRPERHAAATVAQQIPHPHPGAEAE